VSQVGRGNGSNGGRTLYKRRRTAEVTDNPLQPIKTHLALGYADLRKGIDGLGVLVERVLEKDPFSGHLFVFRGKRADLIPFRGLLGVHSRLRPAHSRGHRIS
jgi:transposase